MHTISIILSKGNLTTKGERMKRLIPVVIAIMIAISACGTPVTAQPVQLPVQTPTPGATVSVSVTAIPTATMAPLPTPQSPSFMVAVPAGANCRLGPGLQYPILAGIVNGTTVPILGKSDPKWGFPLWWYVTAPDGKTQCFIYSNLGTTSGNTDNVQVKAEPPLPYYSHFRGEVMTVALQNDNDSGICRVIFYNQYGMIPPLNWNRGEFAGGDSKYITLPVGKYNVDVYNCKLVIKLTLKNVHVNSRNETIVLSKP
jgi:hypothetical protein